MLEWLGPLRHDFMQLALAAGLLVGCTCAYLGVFLVLKRIVFLGAALAEVSAAGLALGLLTGGVLGLSATHPGLVGPLATAASFALTLAAIVAFWLPWSRREISRESLIGYAYATAVAVAALLVALNPGGELHDLDLLSGNLLFLGGRDFLALGVALLLVWALHLSLRKEFVFVSVDPETAATMGLPARRYDFLIHLSVGLTIAVATRLVGVLFVFASLIIPAVLGLLVGRTLVRASVAAVAFAAVAVVVGVLASFWLDLPTGPVVVVVEALLGAPALALRALRR